MNLNKVVTIATPHLGSDWSNVVLEAIPHSLLIAPALVDLRRGSEKINELQSKHDQLPASTETLAIGGWTDETKESDSVVTLESALAFGDEKSVYNANHFNIVEKPEVIEDVRAFLLGVPYKRNPRGPKRIPRLFPR